MKIHLNRKILVGGLLLAILLSLIYQPNLIPAKAAGEANMDSDSEGYGKALNGWYWSGTNGARISIVDKNGTTLEGPVDFFTTTVAPNAWFRASGAGGYPITNKLQVKSAGSVKFTVDKGTGLMYKSCILNDLPRLVTSSTASVNLEEIIKYFTNDEKVSHILEIMATTGASGNAYTLEDLLDPKNSGLYLMVEPIVMTQICLDDNYVPTKKSNGGTVYNTVMSATDIAAFDSATGGKVHPYMPSLSHKNLPFGLFLKKGACGMEAWSGTSGVTLPSSSNSSIMSDGLGVGLVKYQSFEYERKAKLVRFIDLGGPDGEPDGFYNKDDGDVLLMDNPPWPDYYSTGSIYGTKVSPDMIYQRDIKVNKCERGRDYATYSGRTYKYNSTYGSYKANGSEVDTGCVYIGSDVNAGWSISHNVLDKDYYFYIGYVDPTQSKRVTIHYIFDDVEDLNRRRTKSDLEANSSCRLNDIFPEQHFCKEELERTVNNTTVTYKLTDVYREQNGKQYTRGTYTPQGFWRATLLTMTSNVDVYVCYTSPQSYKATLQYVTENGKGLSGTLANNTTAKTQSVTITEGTKVRGTGLFSIPSETAYKTLTTSDGKKYEIDTEDVKYVLS